MALMDKVAALFMGGAMDEPPKGPEAMSPDVPPPAPANRPRATRRPSDGRTDEEKVIERCYSLFEEFRSAYVAEWARQDHNERLYRGDHWEETRDRRQDDGRPEPMTPMIQSIVENVQADLMDGFPQAVIRPESPRDNDVADVVGALIAQNHDAQNFRAEYRHMVHDLLVQGWCAAESGYDPHAYNNIGMGFIRYVNCRSILFDPQVEDIQDGRAVFKIQPVTIHRLEELYPQYEGQFESDVYDVAEEKDRRVTRQDSKNLLMIEYWWREFDAALQIYRVHMVKCAGHKILEDSRRAKPEGYYAAGTYPFVVTTMLRRKGSPLGLGFGDAFGPTQIYTDKLDQIVMMNAFMASKPKLLVQRSSGFDVSDLQDWAKEVHEGDNIAGVSWESVPPLPAYILNYGQQLRQMARDESGANDFSRGNTASGVTAASAIAALQEASGKRSRMINRQMHESYKESVRMEIEFEREFNMLPREVLVMRGGEQIPMTFEAAMMTRLSDTGVEVPIEFFVSIKVEQERRFQTQTQNELMLQLLQMGILNPQQAVENMVFDGKDQILKQMADAQAEAKEQQEAMLAAQAQGEGGEAPAGPSPEEEQAAAAQAQAEQAMQSLPDPSALAQAASGAGDQTILMGR